MRRVARRRAGIIRLQQDRGGVPVWNMEEQLAGGDGLFERRRVKDTNPPNRNAGQIQIHVDFVAR